MRVLVRMCRKAVNCCVQLEECVCVTVTAGLACPQVKAQGCIDVVKQEKQEGSQQQQVGQCLCMCFILVEQ